MNDVSAKTQQIIVDTDIGTDVDDIVALGLALRAPTIDVVAVTTVYVDAALRARMVESVLATAGCADIPVGVGMDRPLLKQDPLHWAGWEGEGLIDPSDAPSPPRRHAVDLLIDMVRAHPGDITILAIGPLTNVALALLREPRLASQVRRIVIMGGLIQRRADQLHLPYSEHNIRCDPEAAQVVLTSGAPITLVPLDVTTQVYLRREELVYLKTGDKLAALVADQVERYLGHVGRDWTHPHDPLACAAIAQPTLLQTEPMRIHIETRGEYTRAQTVAVRQDAHDEGGHVVDVALNVDGREFERWLLTVLAGPHVSGD